MHRFLSFRRLGIAFFGLFGMIVAGLLVYQQFWVSPGERCEAAGNWYDVTTRTCATPIFIPDITGRPIGVSRLEASKAKNAELLVLERQVAEQKKARQDAVDAERARLRAQQGR